jgi:hypothetical protein
MTESIAILDFGSQYAQIIARRVREVNVLSSPADQNLFMKRMPRIFKSSFWNQVCLFLVSAMVCKR